jgi:hypothetical protein
MTSISKQAFGLGAVAVALGLAMGAQAASYPAMAPIAEYRMSSADEAALARSAAPPSISDKAEVWVLGAKGYERAQAGTNGFACIVERSWANDFGDAEFWNPKVRGPICFNAAAARTVLPTYLKRTEWVLAGATSLVDLADRTKAALAKGDVIPPEVGSMCYMMSKGGYLGDSGGHWKPHLMYFLPRMEPQTWGADLAGSPVMAFAGGAEPLTVFFVPVTNWSDGTPSGEPMKM